MRQKIGIYLEQQILSASPLELVVLSYRTASQALRDARRFLAEKNIRERVRSINLAYAVLVELYRTLDFRAGGQIAKELGRLYEYIMHRLLIANFEQTDAPLAEVLGLLTDLLQSWEQVAAPSVPATSVHVSTTPKPWEVPDVAIEQGTYSATF